MRRMYLILATATILLASVSCGQHREVPVSMIGVKEVVARLDSAVAAIYGMEPTDSTFNDSIASQIIDIMDENASKHPDADLGERGKFANMQKAHDEAKATWTEFKRLCDADRYEEALDFYLGEGEDHKKKNEDDFLVFLKFSTQRFEFFSQVLLPMMREYKGDSFATEKYIDLLKMEKVMEDTTIALSVNTTRFVPVVYPYVIQELGDALASTGRMDEAQDLFSDLTRAIYIATGDALSANFYGNQFRAGLYLEDGKPDQALEIWDGFKDFLKEHISEYEVDDLSHCLNRIEEEKARIVASSPIKTE